MRAVILHRLAMLGLWGLCQVAAVIASVWMLIAALAGSRRAWTLAVAHDQLANARFRRARGRNAQQPRRQGRA